MPSRRRCGRAAGSYLIPESIDLEDGHVSGPRWVVLGRVSPHFTGSIDRGSGTGEAIEGRKLRRALPRAKDATMNDTEFPWMLLAGLFGFVGLIVALAVPMFSTSEEKPTVTPSPLPQPSQAVSTHGGAPVAALPATEAPEGVALLLTFMGVLAILVGGFGFNVAETSIHQNTFTLIGLGGAIWRESEMAW